MTDTTDDIDLTPAQSLVFWAVLAITTLAVTSFCAGLLYPFFL